MLRVALADDHQVVLDGLKAALAKQTDLELVGEATDGTAALALVERAQPDVLVLDVTMPGMSGLEVARVLRERRASTHIVMLSMHANEAYVAQALLNGATGYVLKNGPLPELVQAIRMAAVGQRYLSQGISQDALERYVSAHQPEAHVDPWITLTPREREVATLAASGLRNNDIADKLGIGRRTVESHRENAMRKLGMRSVAELARFAVERGLLDQGRQ